MTQRPFVNVNDIELTPQTPQKPEAGFEARQPRSVPQYHIEIAEQRATTGQHDSLVDDVGG